MAATSCAEPGRATAWRAPVVIAAPIVQVALHLLLARQHVREADDAGEPREDEITPHVPVHGSP